MMPIVDACSSDITYAIQLAQIPVFLLAEELHSSAALAGYHAVGHQDRVHPVAAGNVMRAVNAASFAHAQS